MASSSETFIEKSTEKKLFKAAMKRDWGEVWKICSDYSRVHASKITRSGDTVLHIAVADNQENIVEKLVDLTGTKEALSIGNDQGNTPLHVAAMIGSVRMCQCIAKVDSKLVGTQNKDGETPFFLAALHGKKDAFLCLNNICGAHDGASYSRRRINGDTILHCAIAGDYFDLAYQIIKLYESLVNYVNEQGLTPLHILATKPSAFRSGSHLSSFHKIIYHCIFVDELTQETLPKTPIDEKIPNCLNTNKYPMNYLGCIGFIQLLWNMIRGVTTIKCACKRGELSVENQEAGVQDEDEQSVEIEVGNTSQDKRQPIATQEGRQNSETGVGVSAQDQHGQPIAPHQATTTSDKGIEAHQLFPSNYDTCFESIKNVAKAMLVILGLGFTAIRKLQDKKEKNTWAVQIMNELLQLTSIYEYENDGKQPQDDATQFPLSMFSQTDQDDQNKLESVEDKKEAILGSGPAATEHNKSKLDLKPELELKLTTAFGEWLHRANQSSGAWAPLSKENSEKKTLNLGILAGENKSTDKTKKETAILIAAKNGVVEMVDSILKLFPVAILDTSSDKKNIVLLAVENRQPHVYQLLLEKNIFKEIVFRKVDDQGNSALHLAAKQGEHRPWLIPGAALQMQWEIKWYEFVKNSMPPHFFVHHNKEGKTPKNIFTDTHQELIKNGGEWLTNTSESCSVVAALIATVAFATSATVPGGIKAESGKPTLENQPAFNVFAISSLVALCFSVTAVVMFLAILTSRYQERDFGKDLPRKLLFGLTSLFVSIASMLISFCAGHFFVLKDKLKYAAFPVYAVTCLPVTFFAIAQFPLYFDLIWATIKKVPQRSYEVVPH